MSAGIQTSEVRCGAMRIFVGPSASETELGATDEGTVIRISQLQQEIPIEEYGSATPVTVVHDGDRVEAEFVLKQWDPAQMVAIFPGAVNTNSAKVRIGRQAGIDLSGTAYAKRWRFHPITTTNTGTANQGDNIIIHKGLPRPAIEARFNNREARLLGCTVVALVDTSQSDGQRLILIGQS